MNSLPQQLELLLARRQATTAEIHQRLAHRIHDEISEKLTILALQLSLEAGNEIAVDWKEKCNEWSKVVIELCHSAREINDELQPRLLDQLGLTAGLQWYARKHGTEMNLSFTPPCEGIPLPPEIATELFTVCRELLTQLYPRIKAKHVDIQAEESDGLFWLHFRGDDNGFGRKADPERDLDILSLQERVRRMGGSLQLATAPGSGTSIVLSFDLPAISRDKDPESSMPMPKRAAG
jgi:signal transduction histidine kinase